MKTIDTFKDIVRDIIFRDWRFIVEPTFPSLPNAQACHLVLEFDEPCNLTGAPATQRSRKWMLSQHMTKSEVVQTAWLAVKTAMEHEMREQFLFQGAAIFGPHFDVMAMRDLCTNNRVDVRADHRVSEGQRA